MTDVTRFTMSCMKVGVIIPAANAPLKMRTKDGSVRERRRGTRKRAVVFAADSRAGSAVTREASAETNEKTGIGQRVERQV